MDALNVYRDAIERVLLEHTLIPYSYGDIKAEPVFDRTRDRYLVMLQGWDRGRRVHGSLIHVEIIDGQVWIQRDGTEEGVAVELARAGIPKDKIVFGFRSPEARKHIDFSEV